MSATSGSDLRVGIIGLGGIGAVHAKALGAVPGLRLVAFSGGTVDAVAECGWPDARRVAHGEVAGLEDVDVVAVCSPSATHAHHAAAAARAGKHVLVEKPIALSVRDASELARLQHDTGLLIAMVAQRRLEPEYAHTKVLLRDGLLGEPRLASTVVHWLRDADYYGGAAWKRSMSEGGGSLMNQGVHNVDLLRWIVGPVETVTAQYTTQGQDMDAEDTLVATLRFASGALGTISISTATPPGLPATLTVHTSRGVVELGQGDVARWDMPGVPAPEAGHVASGAREALAISTQGHVAVWESVRRSILEGVPYDADAVDAEATVRLLCGIYAAAKSGQAISLADL